MIIVTVLYSLYTGQLGGGAIAGIVVVLVVIVILIVGIIILVYYFKKNSKFLIIMPRAELLRHTVIVLSVRPSVCLSVFYKHFSSLAKN